MKSIKYLLVLVFTLGFTQLNAQLNLDVPYVPTPMDVVEAMLDLGKVGKNDVVYDLGCGDGRIVVTAAKKYGATGIGVDLNPERIKEANENAKEKGVEKKVKFYEGNLFDFDFSKASVLTLYLLPDVNLQLKPKILAEMKPGSRVVSHAFDMGDWKPDKQISVDGRTVYMWTVPNKKK
ncbi:class I SAM-dependent methyltransferase [Petrimonas sp.]|uniref:class I SAM-dependent methyltransferase n=1 Tax=Petrimonas sp. TaxID=2023866 RepID=UPI003F50F2C4